MIIKPLNIKTEAINSKLKQALGFMFQPKGDKGKLFIFDKERHVGIHMLFVFFPLVVVWLDSKKKVRQVKTMYPFASFASGRARYVLEIPSNSEILGRIKVGNKLTWR